MTVGLQLIRVVCELGARNFVRHLDDRLFEEDEQPALRYLRDHYQRFGQLPSVDAFREQGIRLNVRVSDTAEYYLNEARRRAVYRAVQARHRPLNDAMAARDMNRVVDLVEQLRTDVVIPEGDQGIYTLVDAVQAVEESYAHAHRNFGDRAVPTSHQALNDIVDGYYPGEVAVFAARPNVGKSWLMILGAMASWEAGYPTLLLSMEMTALQMARRMVGQRSGVNPSLIRRGELSTLWGVRGQMQEAARRMVEANHAPFVLVEGGLRKSVRDVDALVQEYQPQAVFIDASYLLQPGERHRSKWEALADVNEGIKDVAMRRHVPIVHSVQLNRDAKKNARGDYDLGTISGTDVIGQVASVAVFIREGWRQHADVKRRLYVTKNREGRLGRFTINWRFDTLDFGVIPDDDERRSRTDEENQQRRDEYQAHGWGSE